MEQKIHELLITSFEPFGGETENASMLAVNALPDTVGPWHLHKAVLPVEFGTAGDRAVALAEEIGAEVVICVGQAGGRGAVTPELVALNLQQAPIPDNAGRSPQYEPVVSGAQDAYFSTLPVIRMADAMRENGVPGVLSLSAGLYVCNDLYYHVLHHFHGTGVRAAFIHVPAASGTISMDPETAARALTLAIEQIPAES
ncbi:MAG: pyroglutamyl-peptidase I [Clostridia bacterium]|nr:pyroglutamyl-peptidase I [Clostridia bacterium]